MNTHARFNARQSEMLNRIRSTGRVMVEELAESFAITPQTVRKDLQILADAHEVVRFHGGAQLLAGVEYTEFEARQNIAPEQKAMIGRATAERIPNNTALMINAGTTTEAVARALKRHSDLKIITDNVSIANELRVMPGIEVMVPGGVVRPSDGAILGVAAVDFIRQFRGDIAVIGAAAIAGDGALLDYDLREAHVARAIMENSRHVILAADGSKFGKSAPVRIGDLSHIHTLITDQCTDEGIRDLCLENDVELVEAAMGA